MAFKVLVVVRAPKSNPETDRSFLKAENIEVLTIAFDLNHYEKIVDTCIYEAEHSGIQAIILCPAVSNDLISNLTEKIGHKIAIFTGRGDFQSVHLATKFTNEEWFSQ